MNHEKHEVFYILTISHPDFGDQIVRQFSTVNDRRDIQKNIFHRIIRVLHV
jgi:hypothetical protein